MNAWTEEELEIYLNTGRFVMLVTGTRFRKSLRKGLKRERLRVRLKLPLK